MAFETAFTNDGRDLVDLAQKGALRGAQFRTALVDELYRLLSAGRSVLLVGEAGAGKTAVIEQLAMRLTDGNEPLGIQQFSTTTIMSGTLYLGEWQSKITSICKAAIDRGAVLYFTDVLNLPTAGKTKQAQTNLLDAIRPMAANGLLLLAEATPEQLRTIERDRALSDLFTKLDIPPLSEAEVDGVLASATDLDEVSRQALVHLTSRFLPARPQPGPALDLLEQVLHYRAEKLEVGEPTTIDVPFVEKVFSIYSGLPLFIVSRTATAKVADIRGWFAQRLVGQAEGIEAVVEAIALFKAGLHDPNKPLGTFLFVGPTGVGKTELARQLATFLFGSTNRMLRFDLSEFKDYHSFEMLLGNPKDASQPARLVDPVRAQPFQVILFDELEKAHANLNDMLLPLLDEGRVTPPGGKTVDFRNTIVICTSNVGAAEADSSAMGFGGGPEPDRGGAFRKALEAHFRPEFLNRFQHIAVFHSLTRDQIHRVFRIELGHVLEREGIARRNLVVDVTDAAIDRVIDVGYDARYGARGLKRAIQRQLVLPLATAIMERGAQPGQILKVDVDGTRLSVRMLDTDESRTTRREAAPVVALGKKLDRPALVTLAHELVARVAKLAQDADEAGQREELDRIEEIREGPGFWSRPDAAALISGSDRVRRLIDRLGRLRNRATDLEAAVPAAQSRKALTIAARQAEMLARDTEAAHRELVLMGPDGPWDALVEVGPVAPTGRLARDTLITVLTDWAQYRRATITWIRAPLTDDEPAVVAIKGRYAFGTLRLESGLHRVRTADVRSVARVRVAPWTPARAKPVFSSHHALKRTGQLGGRVRSRLELDGGLVLQNADSLATNRDIAAELAGSWQSMPAPSDDIIRRYDLDAPLVRDVLTGTSSGRPDALSGARFDALLNARLSVSPTE
jgi:ATP-dependent Clp protease ATP-binding subunit ClpC